MMRSSDSKRGDKSHFSEQYTLMKDINTMRTLYDFFKEYDLTTFDPTNIPQTEILLGLKEQSVSIVEDWLKEYTIENINNLNVVQIPSKQVFSLFKAWLINDGRKFDSKVSGFSMKLTNLRIKGCDKGALDKYANATKLFDFKLLKKYFNIGVVNGVVDDIVNDVVDDVVDVEEYIEECDEVYVEVDNVVKNIVVEEYDQQTPPPFGIPVKRKPKI